MQCLWLTLADPEPAVNGQFIYSRGLIKATAAAGAELSVVGLSRDGRSQLRVTPGVDWRLAGAPPYRPKVAKLLSPLPLIALHARSPEIERAIAGCLSDRDIDAVVFDSIALAWALPRMIRHRRSRRAKLVYLAHNHESTVARRIAAASKGLRQGGLALDALKVEKLERRLVQEVDLVASNAPSDCDEFSSMNPRAPVMFLPPGYDGYRVHSRTIGPAVPRRAVVVGSFNFPPKRHSIEAFLQIAVPRLSSAGVELQIVGNAEEPYLAGLRRRFPSVEFTGEVPDVRPFMANARIALVPDTIGGFKLKALDYVFNRLPIFSMNIAIPGMPLRDRQGARLFDSHQALTNGVVAAINDFDSLNEQHDLAFRSCVDQFDWERVGRTLLTNIQSVRPSD
jgi:hypothetical protein